MKYLKKLVKEEAALIKKYATKGEINKLNYTQLNSCDEYTCVYGQMTGSCYNERAFELIKSCAIPYSYLLSSEDEPTHDDFKDETRLRSNFTAIEFYIAQPKAKNKKLIEFLKGETETLSL